MPWLFLAAAAVGALFTLNAFRPARLHWLLQGAGFFASWLTGELVAHHLFWQVAATLAFVGLGGADEWPGWIALGLCAASWAGLVRLMRESNQAEGVVEAALEDALGPGYREGIRPELAGDLDEGFSPRQLLAPLPVRDGRVERIRNVVYREVGGRKLRLDVYRGRAPGARRPALLQIHGGGWMVGSKDEQGLPLMVRLAAHGWTCFSAQYRLSPRATFPDHIADVKAAIRWIRAHAEEYGADPDFLVITGGSAGGHLSALAALTPGDAALQPGFEGEDTRVEACVPFYGVYDFTDRKGFWRRSLLRHMLERHIMKRRLADDREAYERASPMSQVNPDAPPFFVVHGTRDTLVPIDDARTFVAMLREASRQPVGYAEIPGAQHAFEVFPSVRTGAAIRGVERFLAWVYSRYLERKAREGAEEAASVGQRAA